jgi:hypothetical protein
MIAGSMASENRDAGRQECGGTQIKAENLPEPAHVRMIAGSMAAENRDGG